MDISSPSDSGQSSAASAASSSAPTAASAPSVIDLTDDSLVRLPGAKDPVKYGDHYRGFQSEFTKKAQAAAKAEGHIRQLQQQIAEQKQRLAGFEANQPQRPNKTAELTASLKSLAYLSGEDAARVVEHLSTQFSTYEQALQQRDLALALMYNQLKQLGSVVGELHGGHQDSTFDAKIANFMKQGGIPDRFKNRVKEVYLAYEGDDLDQEFPTILKSWWEDLTTGFRESEKRRIEDARKTPFVPGKGGSGTPSKPLENNLAHASAKSIADQVWSSLVDGGVET